MFALEKNMNEEKLNLKDLFRKVKKWFIMFAINRFKKKTETHLEE